MPPTAFASLLEGLPLTVDETEAIEELLVKKSQAGEKDCVLSDTRLDGLLTDRYDELNKIRWRRQMPVSEGTRSVLEAIFRKSG